MSADLELRELTKEARRSVEAFLHHCRYAHHHWSFCSSLDGLETRTYLGAYQAGKMVGVLDCPPGAEGVTWLNLFAADPVFNLHKIWRILWDEAKTRLPHQSSVHALASSYWLNGILQESSFHPINDIIFMERKSSSTAHPTGPPGISIQWMQEKDIETVYQIDHASFAPPWRINRAEAHAAFLKGDVATVAMDGKQLIGYQISTANRQEAELIRIAVHPEHQGRGAGTALLDHLLQAVAAWGDLRVTLNTHKTNMRSVRLYKKFGFTLSKKKHSVFQYSCS